MRQIVILLPSFKFESPVLGAAALANAIGRLRKVYFVSLDGGDVAKLSLGPGVETIDLLGANTWIGKRQLLARILTALGGRSRVSVISSCLSSDMVALTCRPHARIICSVRANLPMNYGFTWGIAGHTLGALHLTAMRRADAVVAMTDAMASQVARFTGRRPSVIANFVDERLVDRFRLRAPTSESLIFSFVGSLTVRKQPLVLVEAAHALRRRGIKLHVHFLGEGTLRSELERRINQLKLADECTLHGNVSCPFPIVAASDALVLPSLSEGTSRAVLEAMCLGVPAVLRDVDGNRELLRTGENGSLFKQGSDLPDAMMAAARLRRARAESASLLPDAFRQEFCAQRYLELAEAE